MQGFGGEWDNDPGPCPVDDAPHTTCTSPDYTGGARGSITVACQRPRVLDVAPAAPPVAFTTKTYRRKVHGRLLRGDKA